MFFVVEFNGYFFPCPLVDPHTHQSVGSLPQFPIHFILLNGLWALDRDIEFQQCGSSSRPFLLFLLVLSLPFSFLQPQLVDVVGSLILLLHQVLQQIHVHHFGALFLFFQRLLVTPRVRSTVWAYNNFS